MYNKYHKLNILFRVTEAIKMKSKQWLYGKTRRDSKFLINGLEGGYAGSLVGLGFIKRGVKHPSGHIDQDQYKITPEGQEWIKNQGVK